MRILSRYVLREILKYLVLVLCGAVGLYLVVDFFENFDNFIEAGLPAARILVYFQYKLPLVVMQVLPVGVLLASLVTLGLMNRNNEILAVQAGGAGVGHVLKPVLAAAAVFGLGLFFFSETVVPIFTARANAIWRTEVKKKPSTESSASHNNIWIKENRAIYFIAFFNRRQLTVSGVALNFFDDHFNLVRRVDAERGVFRDGAWHLEEVMEQARDARTGEYSVRLYSEKTEDLGLAPEDLKRVMKKAEEMDAFELWTFIQEAEAEGYDASAYRVDFFAKFAQPAGLFLVLMAAGSLAVQRRIRDSLVLLMASGGAVFFTYYVLHSFFVSIGYGGGLPPWLAAWAANGLFAAAATVGVRRAGAW
jgi:lipopolysaccharide export system permease protein